MPNPTSNGSERNQSHQVTAAADREYLIGSLRGPQAQNAQIMPMSAFELQSAVASTPMIKVKKSIPRHSAPSPMSMVAGEATDVIVADIEDRNVALLRAQSANRLAIEPNEPLDFSGMSMMRAPGYMPPFDPQSALKPKKIKLRALGLDDAPLQGARVMLQGAGLQQSGVTDAKGEATLDLWSSDGERARSLWIKPRDNHWDLFLERPDLVDSTVNIVRLQGFSETSPGFPEKFGMGWGLEAMGLSSRPDFARGKGIKIAIIDSGCDNTHPLLTHVTRGLDASSGGSQDGWTSDTIGHGTHVAGIITANGGPGGTMLAGFAPEAEIHVIKVFPGGYDSLIEAINYCASEKIDVVNMSLGGAEISVHVEQAIQDAVLAGVAFVVAAGNSGDGVKYPASSPNTLAVAAVGNTESTPRQSWGNTQIVADSLAPDGTFAAQFSCHGPQINVCAPGVAIVSTMPSNAFGADDGTSMAAPHVTGLAALLLAHSRFFREQFAARDANRVTALFAMLRNMCRSFGFANGRSGDGMPMLTPDVAAGFLPAVSQGNGSLAGHNVNPASAGGAALGGLATFSAMPLGADARNSNRDAQPFAMAPPYGWVQNGVPLSGFPFVGGSAFYRPYGFRMPGH